MEYFLCFDLLVTLDVFFIYDKDNFFHIFIQDSKIVSNIKKTNMFCVDTF